MLIRENPRNPWLEFPRFSPTRGRLTKTETTGFNRRRKSHGHYYSERWHEIYYKDWGKGQPMVFSHGWPLSADDWDAQMLFFGQHGYRVIAHDRRGHGRSTQTWDGNEMDTYADDLAALTEKLDLKNAIHVGHSTGGGEVARYIGRHGTKRVAKAVLISAVPPLMLKTEKNPGGLPLSVFDDLRAQLRPIGRSSTGTLRSRSTAITGPAPRFQKASGNAGGCRG